MRHAREVTVNHGDCSWMRWNSNYYILVETRKVLPTTVPAGKGVMV